MHKNFRSLILSTISFLCIASVYPIPAVFVEGLFLPSTTKNYSTTNTTTQAELIKYQETQDTIAFLLEPENDATSVWGVTGKVVSIKMPGTDNKSTTPYFSLKLNDIVQIYNPSSNIKTDAATSTYEILNNSYVTYKDAAIYNKIPREVIDKIMSVIHRRYKSSAFKKEVSTITSCNQFIMVIVERLNLEISPTKAIEFITQNFSMQPKINLLLEQIVTQNKSYQSSGDEDDDSANVYRDQLSTLELPEEQNNYLNEQIDNYERNKGNPHTSPSLETYLKLALSLPWKDSLNTSAEQFNLEEVAQTLDNYQYGMDQVKDIIITHLALRMVSNNTTPFVLCLVGKPGTGKTSICKHIADALNKKMYRISLGGIHTSSDITGHSKTYINASEGKIIRALKTTGSASCLILLDEIDKLGTQNQWHGSPADALLHALDPEQNTTFFDEYLGTPFNISRVLFIATANSEAEIPAALRDRMIIVQVPSYSRAEKIAIVRTKLLPRLLSTVGLMSKKPVFTDETIGAIIDKYTFEDGLRGLTNQLNLLIGKFARGYLRNEEITFSPENLEDYLGSEHNNLAEFKRKAKMIENYLTTDNRKLLFDAIDSLDGTKARTPEHEQLRTYISEFLSIPWGPVVDTTNYDFAAVTKAIDESHYGAEEIKESILDYLMLSQRASNKDQGTTLCLYGPPGVGKTSIAQALAKALNKKLVHIPMSSITSPTDLRGIGKEYRGSHLGAIGKALSDAGSTNAIIVLDELDKIPNEAIANALLDILDPIQNKKFIEGHLGATIDLSNILFIATANDVSQIPYPLMQRMTFIEMDAYSVRQKLEIAQNYIIPRLLTEFKLDSIPFLTPELINEVIVHYTVEAGVRKLTAKLKTLIARYMRMIENGEPAFITIENLPTYLGAPYERDSNPTEDKVGVVNGLSFSGRGGSMLPIIAQVYPRTGRGKLTVTGLPGSMLTESATEALAYIRSHALALCARYAPEQKETILNKVATYDVNIQYINMNVDGPSAGLAMCTALVSAFLNIPVNHTYAMTGTIDLLGQAHAIGGINQKFEGARRNGITHIILPEENRPNFDVLREKPAGVEFTFVKSVTEVLDLVLMR